MRILYLEDDATLASLVSDYLADKVIIDTAQTVEEAGDFIESRYYDIILLDRNIDGKDVGMHLIDHIHTRLPDCGIIILSAYGTIDDKVDGLTLGANDYLEKPFSTKELYARIIALYRRNLPKRVEIKGLSFDMQKQKLYYQGDEIILTKKEHQILFYLLTHKNSVVSQDQILQAIYLYPEEIVSNTINVTINNIRKKLPVELITTIKTRGYIIETT